MNTYKFENLAEEHRRLQEAQALGGIGSFEWNLGEAEVVWSDEMYRLNGMQPQCEPITIERTNKLIHPDDFLKAYQLKEASFITPGQYELEHRIVLDDGTLKWVMHRFESIADRDGKVVRAHGTLQDITEKKKAADELLRLKGELAQKATKKYLELLESIDQGFCVISLKYNEFDKPVDYQFIEVNTCFEDQTGIENAAGKWMRDIAADQDEFWFETYGRVAKDRRSERFEYFSTPLNRWFSVYAFPIDEPGMYRIGVLFDNITEHIKAKKKLRENELQFRNILLQSPNIFVVLTGFPEMIITFANEPLFKSWGRTADIIGKPLLEAMPELKEQSFPHLLQQVFKTGESYYRDEEKAVIIKDGVAVDTYYKYVYQAILDDDQKVTGVTIMATDITEQVNARRKIEESEKRFSNLLLESPFAVAILKGEDMVVALANDAIKRIWGKGNELENKPLLSFMPEIKEQGFALLLEKVYTTGEPFYGHEELVKLQRNGIWEEAYFNFIYQPYKDADGTISGVTIIANEVTTQAIANKKIEESKSQLQNVFLNAPAALCILEGSEHKYILANKAYEKLTNRKAEDLLGKSNREVFPELISTGTFELYDKVFETGEIFAAPEYAAMMDLKNEGVLRQCYFNFSMEPLKNDSGEIYAVMAMTYDITEQVLSRKKNEENEKQQAYLLKLSDALRSLADPVEIQSVSSRLLGEHLSLDRCGYARIHADDKNATVFRDYHVPDIASFAGTYQLDAFGPGILATMRRGDSLMVCDILEDPDNADPVTSASYAANAIRAFIATPLVKKGRLAAVLFAHHRTPRRWTSSDIALVEEVAERTWAAVERAKAENALYQSEAKYRTLFNSIDEGVVTLELILDENGRAVDWIYLEHNPALTQQTGMTSVLGKRASELFTDLEPHWLATHERIVRTGKPERHEIYVTEINTWLDIYFSKVGGEESHRIICVCNNITERKNEEEKKEYLLKLTDASKELIDPIEIQMTACKILGEHVKVNRVLYADVIDEEQVVIDNNYVNGVPPIIATLNAEQFGRNVIDAFKRNEKVIFSDITTDSGYTEDAKRSFLSLNVVANVGMGLLKGGRWVATFGMHYNAPRKWTATEIWLLEETAERTWASVERARAEEALRKSEEKYRNELQMEVLQRTAELKENKDLLQTVFDASPNSISVYEILYNEHGKVYDFKILILNTFTLKTIGGRDVIGQNYSDAFPHVAKSGVLDDLIEAASTNQQIEFEKWYHGEGMRHWFRFIATKIDNRLLVTTEDITERKRAEEEIKTHLTLLKQSEDLAQIGSWEYDIATSSFTWSEGMYRLFNLPRGVKVVPEIYLNQAISRDRDTAERILNSFKKPQAFEETLSINANGIVRELIIKASLVNDEYGLSQKLVGIDLDITEAKKLEKTLKEQAYFIQSTNKALPDILFVLNINKNEFIYINHSFDERLGYSLEAKSIAPKNNFHLLYEEDIPVMIAHLEEMRKIPDGVVCEVEYRLKAEDGSLHWFRDRNSPFKRNKFGEVTEKIGIAQDITQSKKAQQELRESNTSLRYANENLKQFASIASHDLQEPLRKLKLFAGLLIKRHGSSVPEEGKELIKKMGSTTDRMRQLITAVLVYSKTAHGFSEFSPTNLDLIFKNLLGDLDLLLDETNTVIHYDHALPTIEAIAPQMNQLFYNLLTNAVKFRKEGTSLVVNVSSKKLSDAESKSYPELKEGVRHLKIVVADNGIGFEQHYTDQIFQIFERLHSVEEYEGTGVGLALCKKIVENHFGHIYAVSCLGKGAAFHIILPQTQQTETR